MHTPTIPNLSPTGSTPLRIMPRPAWQTRALRGVWRVIDSTAATVLALAALLIWMTLIGAGTR